MNKFSDLYDFIDLASANRKYTESVANNLKSTLKIFGKELNEEELGSINMIEDNIEEIFRSVANVNKDKSMGSLNTYKARLLRVIGDYKKYGANPAKIQGWTIKEKKSLPAGRQAQQSTGVLIAEDKKDKTLSLPKHTCVENHPCACLPAGREYVNNCHRIDVALSNGSHAVLIIPANISQKEIATLKSLLDSLIY